MLKELAPIADKLNEERGVLDRQLDKLTEEQASRIRVTPEWTIKDALAHLVGAEKGMLGMAERMAREENPQLPPDYDNDRFNARQVAKRQGLALGQLRTELNSTRAQLMGLLDGLTQQQLELCGQHPLAGQIPLKDLLVIIYTHETTHCKEISDKVREATK